MGFDKEEVRVCLRNLASDYSEAQTQVDRLTVKLKALEAQEHATLRSSIGVQVERVLASAHRVADEVKVDADSAAKKILSEAQEEAARLRSQAEADASALTQTAASRLTKLNAEIERMLQRRDAVNAELHRAADQLDELSRDIRAAGLAPEAANPGWLKSQLAGGHDSVSVVAKSAVDELGGRERGR
jgi:cell division septum initiation protein DivIVA